MAWQDAEVPIGTRNLHFVDRLVHEQTIGGDDLQLKIRRQGHYALFRFCALAITSSIEPTM
jgi:hypothetical protein